MMKIFFCVFWFFYLYVSALAQGNKPFIIKGRIKGIKDGTKIFLFRQSARDTISSAVTKGERFVFKGNISVEPQICFIRHSAAIIKGSSNAIFLVGSRMRLNSSIKQWPKIQMKGSPPQEDFEKVVFAENMSIKQIKGLNSQKKELNKTLTAAQRCNDSVLTNETILKISKIEKEIKSVMANLLTWKIDFVKSNSNSLITGRLIDGLRKEINKEQIIEMYESLTEYAKNSYFAKQLKENITISIPQLNSKVENFSGISIKGDTISLNEILGKSEYLLLDFWASWCGPCRKENVNLKKAYALFNSKGFNILSITDDKDTRSWVKAVNDDEMEWYNMISKDFSTPISELMGIKALPAWYLLDKNGKVIAMDYAFDPNSEHLRGEKLIKRLSELFKRDIPNVF